MSSVKNSVATEDGSKILRITMLGAAGVGKTSLLAAVYSQFENHVRELFLQLRPDFSTIQVLTEKKQQLERANETITTRGIKKTAEMRRYSIGLGLPLQDPQMMMHFTDYPGEWVNKKPEEVIEYIRESDAVWLPIDAAALMEKKGRYHETINQSTLIIDFFKHALSGLPDDQKKLILLVPIKCESYMDVDDKTKSLKHAIEDKYGPLIDQIKQVDELGQRFAIAMTPVQTLGKVKYSHVEDEDSDYFKFVFVRTSKDHPYQPKDVEEVLKYSLPFLLRRYIDSLSLWDRYISDIFKGSPKKKIGVAINKLVKEKKENEHQGFKILHGRRLLDGHES